MKQDVCNSSFAVLGISYPKTMNLFWEQINELIIWNQFDSVIDNYASRGKDWSDYLQQEKLKTGVMDKALRNTLLSDKQKSE